MKYYLVAICDNEFCKDIQPIQKSLSKKYKISPSIYKPYIVLEIIDDPDVEKLDEIITKLISPYKKFKVELNELIYTTTPSRAVNFKIESKGYIQRINRSINDLLLLHGFNVKINPTPPSLYMCLSNNMIAQKYGLLKDYIIIDKSLESKSMYSTAKIDRIELWKSTNNKKEALIKSYILSNY